MEVLKVSAGVLVTAAAYYHYVSYGISNKVILAVVTPTVRTNPTLASPVKTSERGGLLRFTVQCASSGKLLNRRKRYPRIERYNQTEV